MKKTEIDHLFRRYYVDMYRRARALLYDEQESEDVVSDIFENLLHADILPPADDERQLKGYLLAAVRNENKRRMRTMQRTKKNGCSNCLPSPGSGSRNKNCTSSTCGSSKA